MKCLQQANSQRQKVDGYQGLREGESVELLLNYYSLSAGNERILEIVSSDG